MVFDFWYFDSPVNRPRFQYRPPNFSAPPLSGAPEARFTPAPADGVLPDGFFSTTNLPTYVKLPPPTGWRRPRLPRMDCVIVQAGPDDLVVSEPRRVRRGDNVAVGAAEDGSEGIFVHVEGFLGGTHSPNEFRFMAAEVAREHMIWFIENGYVSVLFGGNAVAVHDLEAAIFGTTLGMSSSGESVEGGHGLHMRAINAIRRAGSIEKAVTQRLVKSGIMHALVSNRIPYVLAGSIRDDGPLPDVIPDTLAAQDAMRAHTAKATFAIFVATALHAIAVGNMLPAFVDTGVTEDIRPLTTICVDQTEFVVTKLRDRGTHQAYGVVTNAQDFMHVLRFYVERWQQANQPVRTPAPSSR